MANIQELYGSDALKQAYPKINKNFDKLNIENANLQSQITANKKDIENKLQSQISTVNTNHSNHLSSTSAHGSSSITNQSSVSGAKVTDALNTTKTNFDNHISGKANKHNAQDVNYTGNIAGATQLKQAVDSLKTQLDNATIGAGTSPAEATSARTGALGEANSTLKDRLDKMEASLGRVTAVALDTTLSLNQRGVINVTTGDTNKNITLPTANSTIIVRFTIKKVDGGSGVVNVLAQSSQTIDGERSKVLRVKDDSITVVSNGTGWNVVAETKNEKPVYSNPVETTQSVISLDSNVAKGTLNFNLLGSTYTNIVKNGNFSNGTTEWSAYASTLSVSNKTLIVTGNGGDRFPLVRQVVTKAVTGKKLFYKARVRVTNSQCLSIGLSIDGDGGGSQLVVASQTTPIENQWYLFSGVVVLTDQVSNARVRVTSSYVDNATANGKVMEIQEVLAIDLDAHPSLSGLTAEQINQRLPNWFDGTESTFSGGGRLKSVGKNLFNKDSSNAFKQANASDFTITPLETGFKLRNTSTVSNQYQYYNFPVRLKPNTTYRMSFNRKVILGTDSGVGRVRLKNGTTNTWGDAYYSSFSFTTDNFGVYVISFIVGWITGEIVEVDFTNIQLEEGSITPYEPYKSNESYYSTPDGQPLRSLPNGVKDEFNTVTGELIRRTGSKVLQSSDVTSMYTANTNLDYAMINKPTDIIMYGTTPNGIGFAVLEGYPEYTGAFDSANGIGGARYTISPIQLGVGFPKGTTLADARTALIRKTLIFQLANPIVTQQSITQLNSYPNGIVYIENIAQSVHIVEGNSLRMKQTHLPIQSIDSVIKRDLKTGIVSDITSTCIIDADKLGITSPEMTNGDEITFSWQYPSELSTLPSIIYSYPLNVAGTIESNIKQITQNNKDIVNTQKRVEVLEYELIREDNTLPLINTNSIFGVGTGIDDTNVARDFNKSVAKGQLSASLFGRTYTNVGGSVGDCESTSDFDVQNSTVALDSTNKIFGSNSIIATATNAIGGGFGFNAKVNKYPIDQTKYYLVTAFGRIIDATSWGLSVYRGSALVTTGTSTTGLTNTSFQRSAVKLQPSDLTGETSIRPYTRGVSAGTGTRIAGDGIMVNEISADEYNTMTLQQLMDKYPYINGTKSTLSTRVKSIEKNLYNINGNINASIEPGNYEATPYNTVSDNTLFSTAGSADIMGRGVYVRLEPNTQYRLSYTKVGSQPNIVYILDASGLTFANRALKYIINNSSSTNIGFTSPSSGMVFIVLMKSGTQGGTPAGFKNIQLEKGTIATVYEPYTETVAYLPDIGRSLPNGTKDEVSDKGDLIRRTGEKILQASDISLYTTLTNVDVVRLSKPTNYKYYNTVSSIPFGSYFVLNYPEDNIITFATWDNTANIGKSSAKVGSLYIELFVPKGTYANLAAAQSAFAGTALNYQLAQETTTKLQGISPLYGFNQGTIVVEPYINDEFKHNGTNITLPYAVTNIDEIIKLDGNKVTNFTLDSTGKIVTFTGVNNAYYRIKAPIRPEESTIPTIIHSAPLNRVANKSDLMRINQLNQEQQLQIDMLALQVAQMMGV